MDDGKQTKQMAAPTPAPSELARLSDGAPFFQITPSTQNLILFLDTFYISS